MRFINVLILTLLLWTQAAFGVTTTNNNKVVGKSLKVASNYVTADNFIDGGFENGVASWTGSGTLTATTTGAYNGTSASWAITGTGTRDLVVDTTSKSGTDLEASIFTNSTDSNLYFCAVVNSVESCAQNVSNSGWHQLKIYFTASTSTTLRLKYLGSSLSALFDEVKLAPMSLSSAQSVEQESILVKNNGGTGLANDSQAVPFTNTTFSSLNKLGTWTGNTTYTALKKQQVVVSASVFFTTSTVSRWMYLALTSSRGNSSTVTSPIVLTSISVSGNFNLDLEAGESFVVYIGGAGGTLSQTNSHAISITAIATRDNVVAAWQDGTEWTSYTPTFTNFGTVSNVKAWWRRDGSNLEVTGTFTTGVPVPANPASISLPSGLSINTTIMSNTGQGNKQLVGNYTRNAAFAGNAMLYADSAYPNAVILGASTSTVVSMNASNANSLVSSNEKQAFNFKVPIQGWSSTPTLLALPTSKDNIFSARFNSDGTVASKNLDWIASSTKSSTGTYVITFRSGLFTVAPAAVVATNQGNQYWAVVSTTSTTATIKTYLDNGTLTDQGFDITITKIAPDYTPAGVFVGNVQPDWQYDISSYLTSNPATTSISRATAEVRKMGSGQYKTSLNIAYSVASGSRGSAIATISGITFKNTAGFTQPCSGVNSAVGTNETYVTPNTGNITLSHATATTNSYSMSCNVELESKPTWATQTP